MKFGVSFLRYASGKTDRQTDRQAGRHTDTLIVIFHPTAAKKNIFKIRGGVG